MKGESADIADTEEKTGRLEVVYRKIDELKLNPQNPRRHGRKQVQQLAASIQTFGFTDPVLIDAEDNVIAGHGRIAACRKLGWSEVPTVTIDDLDPDERQALMIAENRLAEKSRWDRRLLAQQLNDLTVAELDFDLPVIGFDRKEIEIKIAGLETSPRKKDADVLPIPLSEKPVSRLYDFWLLGQHRLLCSPLICGQHLAAVCKQERAAMVFMKPTIFLEDIVGTQNHSSLVRNQPEARPAGPAELELESSEPRCLLQRWRSALLLY